MVACKQSHMYLLHTSTSKCALGVGAHPDCGDSSVFQMSLSTRLSWMSHPTSSSRKRSQRTSSSESFTHEFGRPPSFART